MDFEFNQKPQPLTETSLGTVQLDRTENDILITYDFGGSTGNSVEFTNSPLSQISCSFNSDAGTGITAASIRCSGESASTSFTTHSLNNLVPGSYSCDFEITSGN